MPLRCAIDLRGRSVEMGFGARLGAEAFALAFTFVLAMGVFATRFFGGRFRDEDLRAGFDFRGAMSVSLNGNRGTLKNRAASGKAHGRRGTPLVGMTVGVRGLHA